GVILRGSSVTKDFDAIAPGLSVIKLPKNKKVANALLKFDLSSAVVYVEPDYYRFLFLAPNDTLYAGSQWALNNTGQGSGTAGADIDAERAWDIQHDANNVIVAVIDTGIDVNHPDLSDNLWTDPGDPNVHGKDFIGDDANNPTPDNDPMDTYGHGTHVAGIIGAIGNNGFGVSGVCWNTTLMPLKVADKNGFGFLTSGLVDAIHYAVDNGAKVINASYGGYSYSLAEYNAIDYARQYNVIFVAAAGNGYPNNSGIPNDNDGAYKAYPASYGLANIVSVMATNNWDVPAYYANYGATTVDLAAPGGDTGDAPDSYILSTYPGGYAYMIGTSMAAPHVVGAAALMLAVDPNMSYQKMKAILLNSVDKLPGLSGLCVSGGRLNLFEAIKQSQAGEVALWHGATKTPKSSIQAAIDASANGDIVIAEPNHVYFETLTFPTAANRNITVRSGNVNDANVGATLYTNTTIISGVLDDTNSVVTINSNRTSATVLKGFTIRDGSNGAINIDSATPTISDCNITANNNSGDGGGIYCTAASLPIISACTIAGNSSTSGSGGGIFCDGGSDANIVDCNIINNTSSGTGGGIYCIDSSPTISNSIISGNSSVYEGGGIYDYNSPMTITDCNVSNNFSAWDGGGIYVTAGSD
ncbi:MAG: S8 family serine peptidase, partial [Sedimentisphaerales bacterium]|nr:S8 family serine peptidase [Sedimentisphaerales bacterium]